MNRAAHCFLLVCFLLVGIVCWTAVGCKPPGPVMVSVLGTVTWNGKPLPAGTIVFAPDDDRGVPDHGNIKEGKYRLRVKPGQKKVAIYADRETSEPDPIMGRPPREQYLPAKYNVKTRLRAEVRDDQENLLDFALTDEGK